MEPKDYCSELDANEFCPRCAVTQELCEAFKSLITNGGVIAHSIQTDYGKEIAQAWTRIATQLDHPAIGVIMLTYNSNWLIVSEVPDA